MKNLEIIGLDESKVNKVKDALAQSYIMRLQLM